MFCPSKYDTFVILYTCLQHQSATSKCLLFLYIYRSSNRQNTSIHDHVVGHPKDVVQYAPELPSVQAVSCSSRDCRLPKKHVKLSDEALNLCFIDWGRWNSSYISCMIFTFYVLAW